MSNQPYVLPFEQVGIQDVASVGGKNASLGEMIQNLSHLERGQTFTAQWSVADEARAALERLVPDEGVLLRLGKAKSRQGGEVRLRLTKIELSEKSRTDRIDTLQAAAQKLGGRLAGKKVVSITLLSPAIVVDEFLRSRSWIEPEDVGLSGDWAPAAWFSELVCISGWHAAARMPRSEDWAMAAGSCFLFAGTGTQDLAEWMGELEENGIGERRDQGFGEVRCCDEFHARQAEGGVR